jgi:hypothetical protein
LFILSEPDWRYPVYDKNQIGKKKRKKNKGDLKKPQDKKQTKKKKE